MTAVQVAELPLNLSRDIVARGIIHLPVPVRVGSLTGTFCSPFKHKVPSEWNRARKMLPFSSEYFRRPLQRERDSSGIWREHYNAQRESVTERRKRKTLLTSISQWKANWLSHLVGKSRSLENLSLRLHWQMRYWLVVYSLESNAKMVHGRAHGGPPNNRLTMPQTHTIGWVTNSHQLLFWSSQDTQPRRADVLRVPQSQKLCPMYKSVVHQW